MKQYLLGAAVSLCINILTILGWLTIGMWIPAIVNALTALIVVGIWGLEEKWAFPLGYWTVQLLAIVVWLSGLGFLTQV